MRYEVVLKSEGADLGSMTVEAANMWQALNHSLDRIAVEEANAADTVEIHALSDNSSTQAGD